MRGVLESNVDSWKFRRYQQVQEVEVWIADNTAVAHTASYVRDAAEKQGHIENGDLMNAFVTRYQSDRDIVRAVIVFARRLAQESGYQVEEEKRGGVRVFTIAGHDEHWVIWPSRGHVIKIGGRYIDQVPKGFVKAYGARYPSKLEGGMLDGPLPEKAAGTGKGGKDKDKDKDDESGGPTPDWKQYKSDDVDKQIDDKHDDDDDDD